MTAADIQNIEISWKTNTLASCKLFNEGILEDALSGYKTAFQLAESLNNNMAECIKKDIPFIQVYVISCNNIAHTYVAMGLKDQAESMFRQVLRYLLNLRKQPDISIVELLNELKRATIEYVSFIEANNGNKKNLEDLFQILKTRKFPIN
ncbi:hypothetical protein [Pedobacter caeni]|uniref:Tetratricopeptide repeat-containing protein n=1 Tax=Pedobacter caeni TaxID=288992 RepID=A0A1M5L7V1_9SPHI|nr:hypothetical protein [Pedobacter caeni]SHG61046.1 hypothetical protein SAMN04488522_106246 [Pedobacter caeni]